MIKNCVSVVTLLVLIQTATFAQLDPLNNQYLSNQSMINPAYVGVHNSLIVMASTRGQWVGIDGAPWTHTLSAGSSITDGVGAGLLVVSDNYGINKNIEGVLAGSYKINWINHSLSFGLQGSLTQNNIDYAKLNLETPDANIPTGSASLSVSNFGTGVFLKHDRYYAGLSIPKMLKVNLAEGGTQEVLYKRHYYFSAGYLFDYVQKIKIKPSILVRAVEGESVSIDLNGQIIINDQVWLGVSLRNIDALGFNFQYIEANVRVGYAFELPIGPLALNSYGTHELMISLDAELLKGQRVKSRFF